MTPVYVSIATIKERKESLIDTVLSLVAQAIEIHIYQNGFSDYYTGIDAVKNCELYNSDMKYPDMGAAAKFQPLAEKWEKNAYFLTCDDDLIYPPDYVERMIEGIEYYDRKAVCSFHGKNLSGEASPWYHAEGERYPCLKTVEQDAPVTIIGTGCMGWHSSLFDLSMDIFTEPNAADLCFSKMCNDKGITRMVLAHEEGWIKHSEKVKYEDTLYYRYKHDHQARTDIYNSVEWEV